MITAAIHYKRLKEFSAIIFIMFAISTYSLAVEKINKADVKDTLSIGLLPYIDSTYLLAQYNPLLEYIRLNTTEAVHVTSAPVFSSYLKRTLEGQYDLYTTAPHFAALNIKQGDVPLLKFSRSLYGEIYVRKTSKYQRIIDLKNLIFATPASLAVISLLGKEHLLASGLKSKTDFTLKPTTGHKNALRAVAEGRADAGIAASGIFQSLPENVRSQLRLLDTTRKIPPVVLMMRGSINNDKKQHLLGTMSKFINTQYNVQLENNTGFGQLIQVGEQDISSLKSLLFYMPEVK